MLHCLPHRPGQGPAQGAATPARTEFGTSAPIDPRTMTEQELAMRWNLSIRTLQRWRFEGGGPIYLKLARRVSYTVEAIEAFEKQAMRASVSQRVIKGGQRHVP